MVKNTILLFLLVALYCHLIILNGIRDDKNYESLNDAEGSLSHELYKLLDSFPLADNCVSIILTGLDGDTVTRIENRYDGTLFRITRVNTNGSAHVSKYDDSGTREISEMEYYSDKKIKKRVVREYSDGKIKQERKENYHENGLYENITSYDFSKDESCKVSETSYRYGKSKQIIQTSFPGGDSDIVLNNHVDLMQELITVTRHSLPPPTTDTNEE